MDYSNDSILNGVQIGILKELYKQNLITEKQMLYCIDIIISSKKTDMWEGVTEK